MRAMALRAVDQIEQIARIADEIRPVDGNGRSDYRFNLVMCEFVQLGRQE